MGGWVGNVDGMAERLEIQEFKDRVNKSRKEIAKLSRSPDPSEFILNILIHHVLYSFPDFIFWTFI